MPPETKRITTANRRIASINAAINRDIAAINRDIAAINGGSAGTCWSEGERASCMRATPAGSVSFSVLSLICPRPAPSAHHTHNNNKKNKNNKNSKNNKNKKTWFRKERSGLTLSRKGWRSSGVHPRKRCDSSSTPAYACSPQSPRISTEQPRPYTTAVPPVQDCCTENGVPQYRQCNAAVRQGLVIWTSLVDLGDQQAKDTPNSHQPHDTARHDMTRQDKT
eukprot:1513827-Rhodomonas_salina.3